MVILGGHILGGLKGVGLRHFGEPQDRYMLLILGVHLGLLIPHLGGTVGGVGFLMVSLQWWVKRYSPQQKTLQT